MVHQGAVTAGRLLPILRLHQRPDRLQAQDDPFRCQERACARKFSVRTDLVMQRSKIGHHDWLVAMLL